MPGAKASHGPPHAERMSLADSLRAEVVRTFYGRNPPEGVRLMYAPDRPFLQAVTFEHWHFLKAFPRWCGGIMAACPHQDVWEYEVDNLHEELVHDPGVGGGHYELIRAAAHENGWSDRDLETKPPHPKMKRAIDDWYAIVREKPWVDAMAAVHGTEMLADRRLKEFPEFAMPTIVSEKRYLDQEALPPATRRWLSTTAADTEHAGRAANLVEKYAKSDSSEEAVLATFRRSMANMRLYFEAIVERRAEIRGAVA
jgi:pyrroloquinoline quinone (PQQ) biosynthesis protein C